MKMLIYKNKNVVDRRNFSKPLGNTQPTLRKTVIHLGLFLHNYLNLNI